MAATHRFRVFPLYHQVEIRDATDDVDRPLWETGEERVLAAAQCIVLATRSDLYGLHRLSCCWRCSGARAATDAANYAAQRHLVCEESWTGRSPWSDE